MGNVWDIDAWVEEAAMSPVTKFYPTAITKSTGLPPSVVLEHLISLTSQHKLRLLWEVRCPECYSTVISQGMVSFGEEMNCPLGHEFELTQDELFPAFQISDDYKLHVRERKKKVQGMLRKKQMV